MDLNLPRVFEGVVQEPSSYEKHEAEYLATEGVNGVEILWPKYILAGLVGKRVRLTVEVIKGP